MNKQNDSAPNSDPADLRQNAERLLSGKAMSGTELLTESESKKLIHELQVHQIELEMQNEQLRHSQIALEETRDRYIELYDFAPAGYLTLNHENLITEINLPAAALLGRKRENLMFRRFSQFVAPESLEPWHQYFSSVQEPPGNHLCELAMQRGDGSEFHAQLDCLGVAKEGESPLLRIVLTDISDRKRIEKKLAESRAQLAEKAQKLQEVDRQKDEFLAMLAHELRNPLTPILNAAQILKYADLDPSGISWCCGVIDRQVAHLSRLVDDLLDVSRVSRGLGELKKDPLEIRDFIRPALETSQPLIDARRQKFVLTLPPEPLWITGDRIRLSQIVSNLVNNAAKYTNEGGDIGLSAELSGNDVCIRVYDSGCGIDPRDLPSLFDLFYQAESTLDRSQGGLGIGLSLVQSLVTKHGGNVQAFSAGPGQGSEFVVRLPRLIHPQFSTDAAHPLPSPVFRPLRILVIDDNQDVAESLTVLLETEGHQVRTAYDGAAVLEMVAAERPDVVLLDIGLPGMNGYSVAQALRRRDELKHLPLIAVTGYGLPSDRERSRTAGFDEHIVKPVSIETLRKVLANYQTTHFHEPP